MVGIKRIKQGRVTVITVPAALLGDVTDAVQKHLQACLDDGELHLILDCQQVTYMDSAALEMLLTCSRSARRQGGALKLVHLNEVCQDILVATRLEQFVEVYSTLPKALQSSL
jgi:anti-anti-sigma factor